MRTYEEYSKLLGPYVTNFKKGGSPIHIKKANEGKFTASAKSAGMSVQAYAQKVLNDPNASGLEKKRANFALVSRRWNHKKKRKHQSGGYIKYFQDSGQIEGEYSSNINDFIKSYKKLIEYLNTYKNEIDANDLCFKILVGALKYCYNNLTQEDQEKLNTAFSKKYKTTSEDPNTGEEITLNLAELLNRASFYQLPGYLSAEYESAPDDIFDDILNQSTQSDSSSGLNDLVAQFYGPYSQEPPSQVPTVDNSSSKSIDTQNELSLLDEDQSQSTDGSLVQQIDDRLHKYFYGDDDDDYYNDIPLYDNKIYSGQLYNNTGSGEGSKINGLYVSHVPINLSGNKKRSYSKIKYFT